MAKQLNKVEVNLEISASTEKAKKAFMDLNKSLSDLQNQNLINPDNGIRQAAQDARELQNHLSKAVNVDTGRLDLNRFSNSLKSSKKELKDYYNSLMKLGDQGEQAFMQLSRSIATAETSTVRVNKKMQEFATTLKNAARWQVSSSILHGLMGAVQGAYGYAKDLDSALNDIRIVTGLSADEMDKFAVKANQAAKALNTTTTEYAKASLIYFQQGLSDSQVEERTAITMKMANAAGASAETISDQLTAVWNNFYDGSQSLEHFADAMVRLGADTASSSDEIATGLEKFASIGQVIGLGFDEAASALATVTAQTRQSAEVVGTAFKTIFARIQGLNLGETLDDGTTLNKYSEALAKVGISIKNEYGGIKDMNTLLDEMGEKWNLISKDQQIALAQAVGGVRQYNQIVALMDNYDFYQQNLNAAKNADGSLEEQATTYADRWEASEKRVRAAAEGVYDSLINEDFFIEFNNNLSMLLESVEGLVDGLGGMEGVLSMVGSLALRYFAKDIPSALASTKDNIIGLLGLDSKGAKKVQKDNDKLTDSDYLDNADPYKKVRVAQIEGTKTLNTMNQQLNANLKNLSAEEKAIYETKIKQVEKDYELLELQGRELEQEEKTTKELQNQIAAKMAKQKIEEEDNEADDEIRKQAQNQAEQEIKSPQKSKKENQNNYNKRVAEYEKNLSKRAEEIYEQKKKETKTTTSNKKRVRDKTDSNKEKLNELKQLVVQQEKLFRVEEEIGKLKKGKKDTQEYAKANKNIQKIVNSLKDVNKESDAFKKLNDVLNDTESTAEEIESAFQGFLADEGKTVEDYDDKIENLEENLKDLKLDNTDLDNLKNGFKKGALAGIEFETSLEEIGEEAEDLPKHTVKTSEAIAELGSGIMGLVGMTSSIENLFDTFNDEDASVIQKISAAMGGLMSAGTAVSGMYRGLKSVSESTFVQKIKEAKAIKDSATATTTDAVAKLGLAGATKTATVATNGFSAALKSIPVLGWIAAGITLLTGIITGLVAAEEKAKEKRAELAKESKEIADATYEEVEANKELRKSFDDALASYKEGKIEKNELIDTTEELCNKYKIENAELLIAAENYDTLTAAIRRAENEKLKAAKKNTLEAKENAEDVFIDQMREGASSMFIDGKYKTKIGGGGLSGDEEEIKKAVEKLTQSGEISSAFSHDGNDINIETNGQSVEELIALYEDAQQLKDYIFQNVDREVRDESDNYKNLNVWLEKSAESYNNLIALQEQLNSENTQIEKNKIIEKYGEIESQEEYLQAENELINNLWKPEEGVTYETAKELARQALMAEESYSKMAKDVAVIEQATNVIYDNLTNEKERNGLSEEIQKFYNGLSEDQKSLFATIKFDTVNSMEELNDQLAALQARAAGHSIQVELDSVQQAQTDLKSNMDAEDYIAFEKSSGIDWGNEEKKIIEYNDFLEMTYEEQLNYLKLLEEEYSKALLEANKITIKENNVLIDQWTAELENISIANAGENGADISVQDFEDQILKNDENGTKKELLGILQTKEKGSDEYKDALSSLEDETDFKAIQIEDYIAKWKEVEALQISINGLEQENNNLLNVDENSEVLKLKEQKEELLNLSKTLTELEIGDTIEAEEYLNLAQYLPNLTENFTKTADGAYKLNTELENIYLELSNLEDSKENEIFSSFDIANMITDLDELRESLEDGAIDAEAFGARWIELNKQLDLEGIDKEELKDYSEYLQKIAKDSKNLSDELKDNDKASKIVAKSVIKMNKGIDSLANGFENWSEVLKKSSEESKEYYEALENMRDATSDLLDVNKDFVSNKFIVDNLPDIEKAATGDVEAIERLRNALAKDIIANIIVQNKLEEEESILKQQVETLQNSIPDLQVGATLNIDGMAEGEAAFIEQCNKLIADAGMTVEQANAMFDALGFEPTFEVTTKELMTTKPVIKTVTNDTSHTEIGPNGEEITYPATETYSFVSGYKEIPETIQIPAMTNDGSTPKITELVKKSSASLNDFSSLNAGGGSPGGSKKSSTKNTGPKKSIKPERYKEINDKLDDASNTYEKASKAADRLYGPKQIAKMKEVNKELSKEISLLNIKQKQAKDYLEEDKKALEKASADLGLKINIDDNNFITNYTDLMNQADKKLKDAYANAGDTIDDEQQKVLDALEKKVEDFEAAIAQFDETRETLEDIENEVLDKTYERQDRNFEILNKELEIKIDIDDRALDRLEYYADKFSDNFYKLAETYALIFKGANGEGVDKIDLAKDKLAQYAGTVNDNGKVISGDYMRKLESDHHYNLISQAQYVEGLKNAETNIRDALTELNGYDKEIFSAYENTLDEASSTIEDHVDHIEHLSGVFDHYLTLMEMFGKQKDYAAMDNFLGGKVDTIRDRLDIAKEYYETLKETNNAGEYWDKYQEALKSGNEDDINWWKQQWDAEIDALDAAQEEMLNLTEEWAEARRAVIENHIAEAADALEKSLTNDYGFEFLNDEWDKMNTRQEEYLDNVNKVYETNKLMRTAQKALDETDNKVAKQKLKGFIDETQHLQENTNLSKHELEIQQAKYDLLLAEIALEEAQNAKSVVRLSRDNEGNFGYVYTADQDKVADAQQGVDDKRNDLYNLTLEGQKEYMEKYLQASQEMYDELNVLQEDYLNGLITEDEFKIRSESIKKYYQGSFEFQNEMSALEQAYRNGEIKNEEDYNLKQQEILNKYQAEDLGILNQYLYLASVSNRLAKEEDRILQNEYNSGSIEDEKAYNEEKEKLINTFASNSTGVLGDFLSFYKGESEEVNDKVADHWDNGLDFISHNTSDWVDDMDRYLNEVEDGVNEWANTYEDANKDVGNALKDSSRATEDLTDESKALKDQIQNKVIPAVQKEIKAVRDLTSEYGNQRAELLRLIEAYEDYLDKLGQTIDTESGKEEKPAETPSSATTTDDKTPDTNKAMEDNNTSSQNEKIKTAAENLLNRAQLGQIANQDTLGWEAAAKKNHYNAKAIAMVKKALDDSVAGYGTGYDYERAKELLKTYNPDSFDTGGYTGIWGPEGKLALLHEKEIVLNKDDTENLLKTVSFIRELVSMIDSQASMSSLFNMTATTGIMTGNAGMEQQITIYADFPDATDHNEIEMAFNSLLNTASQYANRK